MATIRVVDEDEAEDADYVVCVRKDSSEELALPPWIRETNREGKCSRCGAAVVFRPHNLKRPPKICIECAVVMGATKQ